MNAPWWLFWIVVIGGLRSSESAGVVVWGRIISLSYAAQTGPRGVLRFVVDGLFGLLDRLRPDSGHRLLAGYLGYARWMRPFVFLTDWLLEPLRRTHPTAWDVRHQSDGRLAASGAGRALLRAWVASVSSMPHRSTRCPTGVGSPCTSSRGRRAQPGGRPARRCHQSPAAAPAGRRSGQPDAGRVPGRSARVSRQAASRLTPECRLARKIVEVAGLTPGRGPTASRHWRIGS